MLAHHPSQNLRPAKLVRRQPAQARSSSRIAFCFVAASCECVTCERCLTVNIRPPVRILKHENPVPPGDARPIHPHFQIGADAMAASMADSRRKSSVFHNRKQRDKTSRTGKRAIQLAGSSVEGSLDLIFLVLSSFPAMTAWSLSSVTPPGNGHGLGVVQETIQDRAGLGHVAQEFAPLPIREPEGELLAHQAQAFGVARAPPHLHGQGNID